MIRKVMSFTCSDSRKNGITRGGKLAKGTGKSPLSEYLEFPSDAQEVSNEWTKM